MIRDLYRYLAAVAVSTALLSVPAQSFQQDSAVFTLVVTRAGLDVGESFLQDGDVESARYAVEFASKNFASGLQDLRSHDPGLTDQIHLELLDLPLALAEGAEPDAAQLIGSVLSKIGGYGIQEDGSDAIIVDLLTVADEQYVLASDDNAPAYEIAKILFRESKRMFEHDADLEVMLDLEQQSFFNDLERSVEDRDSFLKVGTLVSAIQRDLLGTEAIGHDQELLYDNIRRLYAQLIEAVDAGDYEAAEVLAIDAYLENFEYLEPTLEKADAEFMYALEINMREDLRNMIKDRQDPRAIRDFLEESILPDLDTGQVKTMAYLESSADGTAAAFQRELKERGDSTGEQQAEVRAEIDFIRATLQGLLAHYEGGDFDSAYAASRTAYLDSYEYIEIPLRPIDPDFTLEVEYQFAELRNLIKRQASYAEVQEVVIAIERNLDESERLVTGSGQIAPLIAFFASFAIIFREGLESVLILGAILTYLEASRNTRLKPYVYYGIAAGVVATGITWVIASYVIEISGANRELIEAIAALSATAVLFYVSFWILNKIEHKKWMEFVKAKVWQATTTGSAMVFVMLAFFTIYREGFETVLFYQAMFGFAKYLETFVGLGFVLGMASLLAIYFVMRRLGRRLPLRALFGLTMGIGAYLSIAFLGNAVRELQVLDIVPYTSMLGTVPRLDINLAAMTGIYPTLETVVAQLVLLSVYLSASTYVLIMRPRKARRLAQMRKSRGNGAE
jgi:high-affinity iron transporter